jgi:glutamine amidotransferase
MAAQEVTEPLQAAIAFSDGKTVTALRYSSDRQSPSMYYRAGGDLYMRDGHIHFADGEDTALILSEPLDRPGDNWTEVPEGSVITAQGSKVSVTPFQPDHSPASA